MLKLVLEPFVLAKMTVVATLWLLLMQWEYREYLVSELASALLDRTKVVDLQGGKFKFLLESLSAESRLISPYCRAEAVTFENLDGSFVGIV